MQRWEEEAFTLLVSEPVLEEYRRVFGYERLRKLHRLSEQEIEEVIGRFRSFAELIEVTAALRVVPDDPDDDKFVECAAIGGAEYLISGNSHLLKVKRYQDTEILSPANFLTLLELRL
jgi:putative PIN family toxin of toxin-antitoxin system